MNKTYLRHGCHATFKCFSRKSYALLTCLHREIKIGVLSAATLSACAPAIAFCSHFISGGDTITGRELGEAVVTASRTPIAADKAARIVTVISRKQIEESGATTVNDLLKAVSEVDVRQRGALGIQTDISINGGTFDQLTILLNGVSISNPQTGHLSADFPVSTEDIERIEILEGAAGRLFGSQAFSGAINIITRDVKHSGVHGEAAAGSFGTLGVGAGGGIKSDMFAHYMSGSFTRTDGGADNSAFNKGNVYYSGKYRTDGLRAFWQAGYAGKEYGANTFYSAAYPNQWESNQRIIVSAGAETGGKIRLRPQLSWIRSYDHFELIKRSPVGENFHRGDVFSFSLNATASWALGQTAIGAELRSDNILSSNLGRPLDSVRYVEVAGHDGKYYTRSDHRTDINYFVEHSVVAGIFTFSAGLLANRNTAVNESFRLYPGVDVSLHPSEQMRLFASWNKAMRLPSFTDLYYKSPTQEGNVGLKPEKVSSARIGLEWHPAAFRLLVQGYYNHCTDMIDWVMYSATDIYHSTNFKLDNYGYSVGATADLRTLLGENSHLRTLTASYAYIYQDKNSGGTIYRSNYALEYLRHKFTASLSGHILSRLYASASFSWQKRMGTYIKYAGAKSTGEQMRYSPYALLGMKVYWKAAGYELYVTGDNLTAHRYYDYGNVRQPGLWIMAGAKINIDL
jgi:iron complex outermembrane receptor protein